MGAPVMQPGTRPAGATIQTMPQPMQAPMGGGMPVAQQYAQPATIPVAQPVMMPAGQDPRQMQALPLVAGGQMMLPPTPVQCTCPACGQVVLSAVDHQMGTGSWVVCLGVCCLGGGLLSWAGLLPCCMQDCQDAYHSCPNCHHQIGVKKFLF